MRAKLPLRLGAVAALLAALVAGFLLGVRPWLLGWGATAPERAQPLLGDAIVAGADPAETVTRAVTIAAPVERVWPWLAQLGQDRGGFYSYELLENLAGCEVLNADAILPEAQEWKAGDRLWMYPKHKLGGLGSAQLAALEPGRGLGFATAGPGTPHGEVEGSWSFVLEPRGDRATRLLVRSRERATHGGGAAFDRLVFEPIHFAMERKLMLGLRDRAEGHPPSHVAEHAMVALWAITFALFAAALARAVRRERPAQPLLAAALAGVAFQVLTLAQPPLWVGAPLVGALGALVWRGRAPAPQGA